MALLLFAAPGIASSSAGDFIAQARKALERNDGIAAEVSLRRALDAGARREAVAAWMGEALLVQAAPDKAREWLGPGAFTPETAAIGFRHLAKLERMQGHLAAAGQAFDRAMAITPRDATMWVEIGRLRYAGGEHLLAIDAADYALKLDPDNVRALEFKAQFVRDQEGLAASLPWFEKALRRAPRDVSVLGEYAATLGDLGRAKAMLAVTRRMLEVEPGNPRAYFLQAALAARAGNAELARGLLARTGDKLADVPAAQLLEGVLELRAGNHALAAEALAGLARRQPANARVQLLLARAYALGGEDRLVIHDYADAAARPDASPYLLALVGRAYEADGKRDLAAPLLDRIGASRDALAYSLNQRSDLGALIAEGRAGEAEASVAQALAANPGSAGDLLRAGDVELLASRPDEALVHYQSAARVRLSRTVMLRMAEAYRRSQQPDMADALVERYLAGNPGDRAAARLVAIQAAQTGDWPRARLLLGSLAKSGGAGDPWLLAELAVAEAHGGDPAQAEATARAAYRLQPGNLQAVASWDQVLRARKTGSPLQAALEAKLSRMAGQRAEVAAAR